MDLSGCFQAVAEQLGASRVSASFYPYCELKHTWNRVDGHLAFRISDYLEGSPEPVIDSLAWYLLCRALRRRGYGRRAERYLDYARSSDLWGRARERYFIRAKTLVLNPAGRHRNLTTVFRYVNSTYFAGKIGAPTLAWATESPSRRLGFYFPPLGLLAANRALDSEQVPRYVLEFVVYHELLHHIDVSDGTPRKRVHHTRDFRQQERLFSSHEDAERWLRRIACGRAQKK